MKRSGLTFLLPLVVFVACSLLPEANARAAEVTLTSGSVELNCVAVPASLSRINLIGPDFSLSFSFSPLPVPICSPPVQNLRPSTYDAVSFLTYQGVTTQEMTGQLVFDETSISGFVEGEGPSRPKRCAFHSQLQRHRDGVDFNHEIHF